MAMANKDRGYFEVKADWSGHLNGESYKTYEHATFHVPMYELEGAIQFIIDYGRKDTEINIKFIEYPAETPTMDCPSGEDDF